MKSSTTINALQYTTAHPKHDGDFFKMLVVGIGALGWETLQFLYGHASDDTCHEVTQQDYSGIDDIAVMICETDMLFVTADFNDDRCVLLFDTVCGVAKEAGVLVVGILNGKDLLELPASSDVIAARSQWVDTLFLVADKSSRCHTDSHVNHTWGPEEWADHAILQMISMFSHLINAQSFIGIDFLNP